MGYYINSYHVNGLTVPKGREEDAMSFCDAVIRAVYQQYHSGCLDEKTTKEVEEECEKLLAIERLEEKKRALRAFLLSKGYPLVPAVGEAGLEEGGALTLEYDWEEGEKWDESAFLTTFIPFADIAQRGDGIGFIGEDEDRWSYVCDGHSGYRTVRPISIWEGRAFEGGRTYEEIRSILSATGLLEGFDPSRAMVVCAVRNALNAAHGEEEKRLTDEIALCSVVGELWGDCEDSTDIGRISDLAVAYLDSTGELPSGDWHELKEWAENNG